MKADRTVGASGGSGVDDARSSLVGSETGRFRAFLAWSTVREIDHKAPLRVVVRRRFDIAADMDI